jgi:Fur family transcriptional regulator, ferric uptake regulator
MREDVKKLLHSAGLKATSSRAAILEFLVRSGKPLSVKTIAEKLGVRIDQVTLYRTLEAFSVRKLARRVDFGHMHAHYEFNGHHHHHLVCVVCGMTEDVACDLGALSGSVLRKSAHFKQVQDHSLEFFGVCKKCTDTKK